MRHIAPATGLDPDKVELQAYEVNHIIWLPQLRYEGADADPVLDQRIEERAAAYWASPARGISDDMGPKDVDVYHRVGPFPLGDPFQSRNFRVRQWFAPLG